MIFHLTFRPNTHFNCEKKFCENVAKNNVSNRVSEFATWIFGWFKNISKYNWKIVIFQHFHDHLNLRLHFYIKFQCRTGTYFKRRDITSDDFLKLLNKNDGPAPRLFDRITPPKILAFTFEKINATSSCIWNQFSEHFWL